MNTVKCPKCGRENLNTNIRCENCGEQLINETETMNNPELVTKYQKIEAITEKSNEEQLESIVYFIMGIFFLGIFGYLIIKGGTTIVKIFGISFLAASITSFIYGISKVNYGKELSENINNENIDVAKIAQAEKTSIQSTSIANSIYIFIFLIFWFGLLLFLDIMAIKSTDNAGIIIIPFSIPFWLFGIILLIMTIKKIKK